MCLEKEKESTDSPPNLNFDHTINLISVAQISQKMPFPYVTEQMTYLNELLMATYKKALSALPPPH